MTNRNRPKVYLSGPIANCTLEQIHGWRDAFTRLWGKENVSDPTDRKFYTDQNYSHAAEIVEGDKAAIDGCEIVLVNITDPPVGHQMWGTPMEIIYSWEVGKRVIIMTDDPKRLSPWVIYHAHDVVTSIQGAVELLERKYAEAV